MKRCLENSKLAVLLMAFVMVLSLSACSESNFPKPESTVTGFFDTLSKGDFKALDTYCSATLNDLTFEDANQEKIAKAMFSRTKGEVVSSQVDGDTATVKVKITSLDMEKIFEDIMTEVISKATDAALSGKELSDAEAEEMMMEYMEESMAKADAAMTTTEYDIKLAKDNGKKAWVIQDDEAFGKALVGNLGEMME